MKLLFRLHTLGRPTTRRSWRSSGASSSRSSTTPGSGGRPGTREAKSDMSRTRSWLPLTPAVGRHLCPHPRPLQWATRIIRTSLPRPIMRTGFRRRGEVEKENSDISERLKKAKQNKQTTIYWSDNNAAKYYEYLRNEIWIFLLEKD